MDSQYPQNQSATLRSAVSGLERTACNSMVPGAVAAAAVCTAISLLGRSDSGSAVAPINASSHVLWGEQASEVENVTARETLPGLAINIGAAFWWAMIFELMFGRKLKQNRALPALSGGLATVGLAYLVDYKLVPKRLTPGWEERLSDRSLYLSLGIMGLGLGVGALLRGRRY